MPRKSPVRHHVKPHQRRNANVRDHNKGSGHRVRDLGVNPSASVQLLKERQSKGTIDEHGRKLKKIGGNISYLDNGRRVSGIVVGIRAEYYLVERSGKVWKVDRHSVFTRVGGALAGAGAKLLSAGKVGLKATVEKAKALDGERIKAGLAKGAAGLRQAGVKGAAALSAELERRRDERDNWKAWKKEMEKEERKVLEREKSKVKRQETIRKFKENIRRGPLWKRALKATGSKLIKEVQGKKRAPAKPKKKKAKKRKTPKGKKITIDVS